MTEHDKNRLKTVKFKKKTYCRYSRSVSVQM